MQRQRQKGVCCLIRGLQLDWPAARWGEVGRRREAGLTTDALSLSSAWGLLSASVSPFSCLLLTSLSFTLSLSVSKDLKLERSFRKTRVLGNVSDL